VVAAAVLLQAAGAMGAQRDVVQELDAAVAGKQGAYVIGSLLIQLSNSLPGDPDARIAAASRYVDSKDPAVAFFGEYVVAEALFRDRHDPAALRHYDRMIELQDAAYDSCKQAGGQETTVDDVYRWRYVACKALGNEEEARKTIVRGYTHFLEAKRYNVSVGWVYCQAVTEVLGDADREKRLQICDTMLAAASRNNSGDEAYLRQVAEVRTVLLAQKGGERVPDFSKMVLVEGTATTDLRRPRMAVGAGAVWLVMQSGASGGGAVRVAAGQHRAAGVEGLPADQSAVAVVGNRVYFGGMSGLFEVDGEGKVVRRFVHEADSTAADNLPGTRVVDVCAAGEQLYFVWREGETYGVAKLDPESGKVTTLPAKGGVGPTGREPVERLWWDGRRLVANNDGGMGRARRGWLLEKDEWKKAEGAAPLVALMQGEETLTIAAEGGKPVARLAGSKAMELGVVDPHKAPEPAWTEQDVYLPTATGLYAVERKTGKRRWVAYQADTPCLSVVNDAGMLFVATTRGIFMYATPVEGEK
jgi:hypothetical protein